MVKKKYIYVFNQRDFENVCTLNGFNDKSLLTDKYICDKIAFISILGTSESLKYAGEEDNSHFFKKPNRSVLNVEFDDVDSDTNIDGYCFKAISQEQADEIFNFIENNVGKTFLIHCRAGESRSAAVGQFIKEIYSDIYSDNKDDWKTYNHCVYRKLYRSFYNKNKLFT